MEMVSWQVQEFGKPLVQATRQVPVPGPDDVVLRVGSCGVCHSDIHLHDGFFDRGHGGKIDASRLVQPPRTLGHEIAGTVLAVGENVRGVRAGDQRVVYPWIGCGHCALCAAGNEHLCNAPRVLGVNRDGGYATHVVVPHERYLVDYGALPQAQACTYACSGLTAYSALRKLRDVSASDPLLVIGAGGVGLSGIRLARHLVGARPLVAEVDRSKWDVAREAGAGEVIDPREEGALKRVLQATGGVAAALDFVGSGSSFEFGLGALRKGGTLVAVGLLGGATEIAPALLALKAVTIVGSYVGTLEELRELMAVARGGALPQLPVTTRPLAEAQQALEALRAGAVRGRTVLNAA